MKILVIGGSGMLGSDLCEDLRARGHEVQAPSSTDFDITDPDTSARLALSRGSYDWCLNCAAYTAVDKAETEIRTATELNAFGPGYLAGACSVAAIKLLHLSTDFVFDGRTAAPYTEDDETSPLGVYGRTKRDGELAVLSSHSNSLIVRTSWLYGLNGRCFPKTMIAAWEGGKTLRVVSDQTGCPTYTVDLARTVTDLVERNAYPGIYHACGPTVTNWHAFAVSAVATWKDKTGDSRPIEIEPIPTGAYPTPATRPHYSVLNTAKVRDLGIAPMRPLADALKEFAARLTL